MSEVGVEIVKTEETEKNGIKYLNINMSDDEVKRNPDIVRLCADAGILEYVKPSGDTISRQAVIDGINRYFHDEYYQRTSIQDCRDCLVEDVIKPLTPVTSQPKTGHWIGHREHCENLGVIPSGLGAYKWCSNCDCSIDVKEWHRNNYNYCPNCGAKMGEPQESEVTNGK